MAPESPRPTHCAEERATFSESPFPTSPEPFPSVYATPCHGSRSTRTTQPRPRGSDPRREFSTFAREFDGSTGLADEFRAALNEDLALGL